MPHLRCLAALALAAAVHCSGSAPAVLIRGTLVTPSEVLPEGWVLVRGERIVRIAAEPITAPDAVLVESDDLIFPGLIDLHNHVAWNVFPRWLPARRYDNRYEWRTAREYEAFFQRPATRLQQAHACDMTRYGEIRAVMGGVTALVAFVAEDCGSGLVRNLHQHERRSRLRQIVDPDIVPGALRQEIRRELEAQEVDALLVHAAEGRSGDRRSREEFDRLIAAGLLSDRTIVLQGTALREAGLEVLRDAGASLVWSPRSNHELYGDTADIVTALELGIPVALGTDWGVTGSGNLLEELRYAAGLRDTQLGGRPTDRELVDMVTQTPARMLGAADRIGTLREGAYADLVIVKGARSAPYRALVRARSEDIRLVLVGGRAVYGEPDLLARLNAHGDADAMEVCGTPKAIDLSPGTSSILPARRALGDLQLRLRDAMRQAGARSGLAPLTGCPPADGR